MPRTPILSTPSLGITGLGRDGAANGAPYLSTPSLGITELEAIQESVDEKSFNSLSRDHFSSVS